MIAYQIRQSFKLLRHNGEYYIVSPYSLVWGGDYYYVVGYSEMREKIQNFRLDRIYRTPELLAEEPQIPAPNDFHLAEYSREVFRMFGTDEAVEVELLCKNYIMNAVTDLLPMGIRLGRGYEDPRSGEREGEI